MKPPDVIAIVRFTSHDSVDTWREAEALRDAGYRVQLICVGSTANGRTETIDGIEVTRVSVSKSRGGPLSYLIQYSHWFAACIAILSWRSLRTRYLAVQVSNLPDHQVFVTLVPKLRGARVVLSFKEPAAELFDLLITKRAGSVVRFSTRLALKYADAGICVTEAHRENYLELGARRDKLTVVSNATPDGWLQPGTKPDFDPEAIVAMTHGTMEERWGYEVIVRAVALAAERLPDLQLVLPGKGGFSDRVTELAAELGIADRVHLPGFVSTEELHGWLDRADIGLNSQIESSYSNLVHTGKLFDFILAEVPVASSRLRATVDSFEGCCLFYESTSPIELADAIVRLAQDPDLAARLVSTATKRLRIEGWTTNRPVYVAAVTGR